MDSGSSTSRAAEEAEASNSRAAEASLEASLSVDRWEPAVVQTVVLVCLVFPGVFLGLHFQGGVYNFYVRWRRVDRNLGVGGA